MSGTPRDGDGDGDGNDGSHPGRIRPATPGDRPRLRALQAELASPWPELLDAALGARTPAASGPTCLVAESPLPPRTDEGGREGTVRPPEPAGGDAVGASEPSPPVVGYALALDGPERLLVELAVAPGHRRRGHGRALVAAVADRPLRVTVRADDEGALAFYASLGFERVERLPEFYDLPDGSRDGVALRLGLE